MNSNEETSKTEQTPTPSSNSSSTASLQNPESLPKKPGYAEDPLVGLCPRPMEEMTEEQLRQFVVDQQTLRSSSQTFKARLGGAGRKESEKPSVLEDYV